MQREKQLRDRTTSSSETVYNRVVDYGSWAMKKKETAVIHFLA